MCRIIMTGGYVVRERTARGQQRRGQVGGERKSLGVDLEKIPMLRCVAEALEEVRLGARHTETGRDRRIQVPC